MTFNNNQQKHILRNGITLLTDVMPQAATAALSFYIEKGSRDEQPHESGMTHFCEHLIFKGTQKYTKNTLVEALDMMGGKYNAYTSNEVVCIYNVVPAMFVSDCLSIFCDMVNNSLFDEGETNLEREVILNELRMGLEIPEKRIGEEFDIYSQTGSSLAKPIIGTEESISGFAADDLRSYYQNAFIAENIIVSIAGCIDVEAVISQLESVTFRHGTATKREYVHPTPVSSFGWTIMPSEQLHIVTGNSSLRLTHDEYRCLSVLDTILGDNMSSRLFQKIREEMGLCYSIYTSISQHTLENQFCISLSIQAKNLKKTINAISDIIADLKSNGITESELAKAKQCIINDLYLGYDKASNRASRMASQQRRFGKFIPYQDTIAAFNKLTSDDVNAVAAKVFRIDEWYTQLLAKKEQEMPQWTF